MKNEHQSIILGKHESHDLSQLTIQDGQVSFKLPFLDDKDVKKISGNKPHVGVEVCKSNSGPCQICPGLNADEIQIPYDKAKCPHW